MDKRSLEVEIFMTNCRKWFLETIYEVEYGKQKTEYERIKTN